MNYTGVAITLSTIDPLEGQSGLNKSVDLKKQSFEQGFTPKCPAK